MFLDGPHSIAPLHLMIFTLNDQRRENDQGREKRENAEIVFWP